MYAGVRIQDLFTPLESSTSALWFVDVYDALEQGDTARDRPLKSYAYHVDPGAVATALTASWAEVHARSYKSPHSTEGHLTLNPRANALGQSAAWSGLASLQDGADRTQYKVVRHMIGVGTKRASSTETVPVNAAEVTLRFEVSDRTRGGAEDPRVYRAGKLTGEVRGARTASSEHYEIHLSKLDTEPQKEGSPSQTEPTESFLGVVPLDPETGAFAFEPEVTLVGDSVPVAKLVAKNDPSTAVATTPVVPAHQDPSTMRFVGMRDGFFFHRPPQGRGTLSLVIQDPKNKSDRTVHLTSMGGPLKPLLLFGDADEPPKAKTEAQALAILAATNWGDIHTAEQWVSGLLQTLVLARNPPHATRAHVPSIVDPRTGVALTEEFSLDAQLWTIYALTRFYAMHPARLASSTGAENKLLAKAYDAAAKLLETLEREHLVRQGPYVWLSPKAQGSEAPRPEHTALVREPRPALIMHQALAYFVWREAENVGLLSNLHTASQHFERTLLERGWKQDGRRPRTVLGQDQGPHTTPGTAALYSLFASAVGDEAKAEDAVDAGLLAQAAITEAARTSAHTGPAVPWGPATLAPSPAGPENTQAPGDPDGHVQELKNAWRTHQESHEALESWAMWILALRKNSARDPRLEDVALVALQDAMEARTSEKSPAPTPSPSTYTSLLLAYHPRGFLGVDSGPHLWAPKLPVPRGTRDIGTMRLLEKLDRAYVETLGAMFASNPQPDLFDAFVTELALFRFMQTMLEQGFPPDRWATRFQPEERLQQNVAELKNLCAPDSTLFGLRPTMERYLGIGCSSTVALFEAHLIHRTGDAEADIGTLVRSPSAAEHGALSHAHALTQSMAWLLAEIPIRDGPYTSDDAVLGHAGAAGFSGPTVTSWDAPSLDKPLGLSMPTAATDPVARFEIRDALRARLKHAVRETIAPFLRASGPGVLRYERFGVSHQAALHPESSHYWRREAIELRVLTDAINEAPQTHRVAFTLEGAKSPSPRFTTTPQSRTRRRTFRQFVYTYADGHLPRVAEKTGLPLLHLHRMHHTGLFGPQDFAKIVTAYTLDQNTLHDWTSQIPPLEADHVPNSHEEGQGATEPASIRLPWYTPQFLSGGLQAVRAMTPWLGPIIRPLYAFLPAPVVTALMTWIPPEPVRQNGVTLLYVRRDAPFTPALEKDQNGLRNGSPEAPFLSIDEAIQYAEHEAADNLDLATASGPVIIVQEGGARWTLRKRSYADILDMVVYADGQLQVTRNRSFSRVTSASKTGASSLSRKPMTTTTSMASLFSACPMGVFFSWSNYPIPGWARECAFMARFKGREARFHEYSALSPSARYEPNIAYDMHPEARLVENSAGELEAIELVFDDAGHVGKTEKVQVFLVRTDALSTTPIGTFRFPALHTFKERNEVVIKLEAKGFRFGQEPNEITLREFLTTVQAHERLTLSFSVVGHLGELREPVFGESERIDLPFSPSGGDDPDAVAFGARPWFSPAFGETQGTATALATSEASLWGPRPEAVAHVGVFATEAAKQLGLKEAVRIALVELAGIMALSGSTVMHQDEINALVDRVFVDDFRNVVVVEEDAPFTVPLGYTLVGWAPELDAHTGKALYDWPTDAISRHPTAWEEAIALSLVDNLGFGVDVHRREEAAQGLRTHVEGYVPQNVILKKTWDGVEIYRKLNLDFSLDRPRGLVLHLASTDGAPALVHHQPGSWASWYETEVLAADIPEPHREAYLRAVHAWLLDHILGRPGRPSFQEWAQAAKRRILGTSASAPSSATPQGETGNNPPPPEPVPGVNAHGGDGGQGTFWRGRTVRWVDPLPQLVTLGLWDLPFSSTDGVFVEAFPAIEKKAAALRHQPVRRYMGTQAIDDPSAYPAGVYEWDIKRIYRSLPIASEGPTSLETQLEKLVQHGIQLHTPLRVYTLPNGLQAIHPDDHDVLAAMNLLGQQKVPVRFVTPPYDWSAVLDTGITRPKAPANTPSQVTAARLRLARSHVRQMTFVRSHRSWDDVFHGIGLRPLGGKSSLWDHLQSPEDSGWLASYQNINRSAPGLGRSETVESMTSEHALYLVRPSGGLHLGTALGYTPDEDQVVLRAVDGNDVLAVYLPTSPDQGVFKINTTAENPLPHAFTMATRLEQISLAQVPLGPVDAETVSQMVDALAHQRHYAAPLLGIRTEDGDLTLLSDPVEVHALKEEGTWSLPAAIIDWGTLPTADQKLLIETYRLSSTGHWTQEENPSAARIHTPEFQSTLFPPSTGSPKIIRFSEAPPDPNAPLVVAVVVGDFHNAPKTLAHIPKTSASGVRHSAILLKELHRQAPDWGGNVLVRGIHVGSADKASPSDVVGAIRAAVNGALELPATDDGRVRKVISLSSDWRYRPKNAFVGTNTQDADPRHRDMVRALREVIAEARMAGVMIVARAESGAAMSEAIVEAGYGQDHFLNVAGTTKAFPDPEASAKSSRSTQVDFLAPGLAPLITDEGAILAKDPAVPTAITAATAAAAIVATLSADGPLSIPFVPNLLKSLLLPNPRGPHEPGQLAPDRVREGVFARVQKRVQILPGIGSKHVTGPVDPLSFNTIAHHTRKANRFFVIRNLPQPEMVPISSLEGHPVSDKETLVLFLDTELVDVVDGRVWNAGIKSGHIAVTPGTPTKIGFTGEPTLRLVGQKFHFLDVKPKSRDPRFLFGEPGLNTDGLVASDYTRIIHHRDAVQGQAPTHRVRRLRKGLEVSPQKYPAGVFEASIHSIFRGSGVSFSGPGKFGGPSLETWLQTLTETGLDLENPVHVYFDTTSYDSFFVWPDDLPLVAAMNLLGETKIPLRVVPRPDAWQTSFKNRAPVPNADTPEGISSNALRQGQAKADVTRFAIGPSNIDHVFQHGLQPDGTDPNLLNHVWNTGAKSAWLRTYDSPDAVTYFKVMPAPSTLYLVRFQGGISLTMATGIADTQTAVPGIPAHDVLAAYQTISGQSHFVVNPQAHNPLPNEVRFAEFTFQPIEDLDLTRFDQKEVHSLGETLDAGNVLEPLFILKDGPKLEILEGKSRAVALRSIGRNVVPAFVIDWDNADDATKQEMTKFLSKRNPVNPKGNPQSASLPLVPKAPRFTKDHDIGNRVKILFDDALFDPDPQKPILNEIVVISTHHPEYLSKSDKTMFLGSEKSVIHALFERPRLFSVEALPADKRFESIDLSAMMDPGSAYYRGITKDLGKGALPRLPAGWSRKIAYLVYGKGEPFHISHTATFVPKTVSLPITFQKPVIDAKGVWESIDLSFSYAETGYRANLAEIYFSSIDPEDLGHGPQDFLHFKIPLDALSTTHPHRLALTGPQRSAKAGLSAQDYFESHLGPQSPYELWTSARIHGIVSNSSDVFRAIQIGPTREGKPQKLDISGWGLPSIPTEEP